MKVILISRGKKRHVWFAEKLQSNGLLEKHFVQEYVTETENNSEQSDLMTKYFDLVSYFEDSIFKTTNSVSEVKFTDFIDVCDAMPSSPDVVPIIFGCSIIKNQPLEVLSSLGAVNIHAGISPEYKGSACNFWAMFDERPDLVGVTLHKLTSLVDDGEIYFQSSLNTNQLEDKNPIKYSMMALQRGLSDIAGFLCSLSGNPDFGKKQFEFPRKEISNRKSVRLSRHKDFTESCLVEFCKSHNIIL
jgi:hypothetical protein